MLLFIYVGNTSMKYINLKFINIDICMKLKCDTCIMFHCNKDKPVEHL